MLGCNVAAVPGYDLCWSCAEYEAELEMPGFRIYLTGMYQPAAGDGGALPGFSHHDSPVYEAVPELPGFRIHLTLMYQPAAGDAGALPGHTCHGSLAYEAAKVALPSGLANHLPTATPRPGPDAAAAAEPHPGPDPDPDAWEDLLPAAPVPEDVLAAANQLFEPAADDEGALPGFAYFGSAAYEAHVVLASGMADELPAAARPIPGACPPRRRPRRAARWRRCSRRPRRGPRPSRSPPRRRLRWAARRRALVRQALALPQTLSRSSSPQSCWRPRPSRSPPRRRLRAPVRQRWRCRRPCRGAAANSRAGGRGRRGARRGGACAGRRAGGRRCGRRWRCHRPCRGAAARSRAGG